LSVNDGAAHPTELARQRTEAARWSDHQHATGQPHGAREAVDQRPVLAGVWEAMPRRPAMDAEHKEFLLRVMLQLLLREFGEGQWWFRRQHNSQRFQFSFRQPVRDERV